MQHTIRQIGVLSTLVLFAACQSTSVDRHRDLDPGPPKKVTGPAGEGTLKAPALDGAALSSRAFADELQADEPLALDEGAIRRLASALDLGGERSVRAAVVLARSQSPRAEDELLARLERRIEGSKRAADAVDVVAAAALGRHPAHAASLALLAHGPEKHPDLEVRVECAASALQYGHDELIPFLLRVLRTHTRLADTALEDWTPRPTMAWAKGVAARALYARAGLPCTFRADASYADQAAVIQALELQLTRAGIT